MSKPIETCKNCGWEVEPVSAADPMLVHTATGTVACALSALFENGANPRGIDQPYKAEAAPKTEPGPPVSVTVTENPTPGVPLLDIGIRFENPTELTPPEILELIAGSLRLHGLTPVAGSIGPSQNQEAGQ